MTLNWRLRENLAKLPRRSAQPDRLAGRPTDPLGLAPPDGGLIIALRPVGIALADIPIERFFRPPFRSEAALEPKADASAQADAEDARVVKISAKDEPVSDAVPTAEPVVIAIDVTAIPELPEPAPLKRLRTRGGLCHGCVARTSASFQLLRQRSIILRQHGEERGSDVPSWT